MKKMDEYGNPIPGSSKEFENDGIMEPTCDLAWLENEFNNDHIDNNVQFLTSGDQNLNNYNVEIDETTSNPIIDIDDFYEEIKCINFSQSQNIVQNNDNVLELLERCNNFIDIVGRNIVFLEEMISEIKNNVNISKRNASKAHECIEFEKKSMSKTPMLSLKKKAHLANFFKFGLSNCPQNQHLIELYDTGRLILSYNGRFILEECIERNLWNQEFKNKLEEAIHLEVLEKIKTPLLDQHARLSVDQALQNDPLIKNKIELEMLGIQKELDIISKTPFKQLVFRFMDSDSKYDWLHIAKLTNKPYLQCQRFWNLMLKPHISREKWTKSEDDKLIEIVKKYGEKNWQQIAVELDTNRNELQCFVHYQKFKKMIHKKGKWTKQEDQKLLEIIKENSNYNIINWQKVYFGMHDEGRSVDQIYNRWMCCLKPGIKKGFLNQREKFIIAVAQKQNLPPSIVSMNLTNRTSSQIRNAYRRISSYENHIFRGGWTPEEDKMLLHAVHTYAPNELTWAQVSKKVPGRNPEQCRHRFKLIEKKVQKNPNMTIDNFPRSKRLVNKPQTIFVNDELLDKNDLQENFRQNRELQKISSKSIESIADRKLKKAFLDNVYVTNHCGFSSKCDLLKYILDYLGANLIVPQEFVHKDDLIDEGLMSMMSYLKEFSIDVLTLHPNEDEENVFDMKFTHENPHDVLRTSDIINSDLSEIEGLLDIRMRNIEYQNLKSINTQCSKSDDSENLISLRNKTHPLPLYFMGSVPPNVETFRMLYSYMNSITTCAINKNFKVSNIIFDWDNDESKKLHQRLVAIFRWPALFSGMIDYNSAKINMIINTEQTIDSNNSKPSSFPSKKKKPYFNLKQFL